MFYFYSTYNLNSEKFQNFTVLLIDSFSIRKNKDKTFCYYIPGNKINTPRTIYTCFFSNSFFPESVRWCHSAGHNEKALQILRNVAKYNGKTFPESKTLLNNEKQKTDDDDDGDDDVAVGTFIDLFSLKYIKTTLILCLMW